MARYSEKRHSYFENIDLLREQDGYSGNAHNYSQIEERSPRRYHCSASKWTKLGKAPGWTYKRGVIPLWDKVLLAAKRGWG